MEYIIEMEQLVALALHEFGYGNTAPTGNYLCYFFFTYGIAQERIALVILLILFGFFKLFLESGKLAVFEFCGFLQVVHILCAFDFGICSLYLLTQLCNLVDAFLFAFPFCFAFGECGAKL